MTTPRMRMVIRNIVTGDYLSTFQDRETIVIRWETEYKHIPEFLIQQLGSDWELVYRDIDSINSTQLEHRQ